MTKQGRMAVERTLIYLNRVCKWRKGALTESGAGQDIILVLGEVMAYVSTGM